MNLKFAKIVTDFIVHIGSATTFDGILIALVRSLKS